MKNPFSATLPRKSAAPSTPLTSLPLLRSPTPDLLAGYLVPRVQRGKEMLTLTQALEGEKRMLLTGPPGSGKTTTLRFLEAKLPGARRYALADFHPAALPRDYDGVRNILLDDFSALHDAFAAELAVSFPETRIVLAGEADTPAPEGCTRLALQPLNDREVYGFALPWFPTAAMGHGGFKPRNRGAEALAQACKAHPQARQYATRPLDLFLLLQVYRPGEPLPPSRADLYAAYLDAVASRQPDPALAARALEGIALSLKRGQMAQDEHLARGCGLLEKRPSGRLVFVHPALQDFLVARALRLNPDWSPLRERLDDPAWRQVVLFYAALGDSLELVQTLRERDLVFAASALAAWPQPPADLRREIEGALLQRFWDENDQAALDALSELQSGEATDFFAARLKDRQPEVRARAAEALGRLRTDRGLEYLLPQLRDVDPGVRRAVVQALGHSPSERVLEPLLVTLRGDTRMVKVDSELRVAAAQALGRIGSEKAVPALAVEVQIGEPPVREAAAQALAQIRSDLAYRPLLDLAARGSTAEVRASAAGALEAYRLAAPPSL